MVGLLFTILVAKSRGVRLIMSSIPYMYLFRILRYSVLSLHRRRKQGGGGGGGGAPGGWSPP